MKNLFKLSNVSRSLISIFLLIMTIMPNNVLAVTNTKKVNAIDGKVTVTFKYALTATPKLTDFVVTQSINNGAVKAVKPTKVTMDSTKKIISIAVPMIVKTTIIQNVVYKVSYKKDVIVSSPIMSVAKAPIKVATVILNKTTDSLTTGATGNLIFTVAPTTATNKAVTWTSSNNNIVTVDNNGKITAVSVGIATITVKTVDGSKISTCTVTVNSPIITATVKSGLYGAIINASSTKEGATQYQVFDSGTGSVISQIADLGTITTIYPGKVVGDKVTIKLLNAAGKIVATSDVILVAPVN
jgi:uncharacterized protein YjdB